MISNDVKLGKRAAGIFAFIQSFNAEKGYPPSVREIAEAVGLKSPSTVHMHLTSLEERGLIRRVANKSRTIELVDDQRKGPSTKVENQDVRSFKLPLVGRVAAGSPILAEENIEEYIDVPQSLFSDRATFVLKVQGTSMINAGILDGDYIMVEKCNTADNGQIVVALLDDSATIKTFYKETDHIRLQPENDAMEPILVKNPHILGRVVGVLRAL